MSSLRSSKASVICILVFAKDLPELRVFPAIYVSKSRTCRAELLYDPAEYKRWYLLCINNMSELLYTVDIGSQRLLLCYHSWNSALKFAFCGIVIDRSKCNSIY